MRSYLDRLFGLEGRVAVVTGAGRGIGRELALGLAAAGATVVVASRSESDVAETASAIRQAGGAGVAKTLDVTRSDEVAAVFHSIVEELGRVDALVNCAGTVAVGDARLATESDWDMVLETNLKGAFFCCREAGKVMTDQGGGKIVNVASALGIVGLDGRSSYCASKGGLISLTRALAVEWASARVNVNAIAPTTTMTGDTARQYAGTAEAEEKRRGIPMGRFGTPQDLVGAVIYLAGPASDFVTGHVLVVDGGYTAR